MFRGIDVSEHQGRINWDAVKAEGKTDFAILRTSHGENSRDKQFERNYAECKRLGIPVGVYHYYYYGNEDRHKNETKNFLNAIAGKLFELPVFVDYEEQDNKYNPALGSLEKAKITEYLLYDCNEIRKAGFVPGVYANRYWLTQKINDKAIPSDAIVWLAEWQKTPTYKGRFEMWQYTSTGSAAGIGSRGLDMNEYYGSIPVNAPQTKPEPVPVPPAPTPEEPVGSLYITVKKGDTLSAIAAKYLGDAKRYLEIAKLNSIPNPNVIHVGQIIRLPVGVAPIPAPAPTTKTYIVKKGDNPWKIAQEQLGDGKRYTEIEKLNGLSGKYYIHPGQVLKIPNK